MEIDPESLPEEMRLRYEKWRVEEEELKLKVDELLAREEKEHQEAIDERRNKDFLDAIDKFSRAGYVGKHGTFVVPEEEKLRMEALNYQVMYGDYSEENEMNSILREELIFEWKKFKNMDKKEAQRTYIRKTNEIITKYGWNPPTDFD